MMQGHAVRMPALFAAHTVAGSQSTSDSSNTLSPRAEHNRKRQVHRIDQRPIFYAILLCRGSIEKSCPNQPAEHESRERKPPQDPEKLAQPLEICDL